MTLRDGKAVITTQRASRSGRKNFSQGKDCFYDESSFNRMFDLEIKRTKRSKKPFVLILIDITGLKKVNTRLNKLRKVFLSNVRETDIQGWYRHESIVGIIFTDLASLGEDTREAIFNKTVEAVNSQLTSEEMRKVYITFHTYPKDLENSIGSGRFHLEFDQDSVQENTSGLSCSRLRKLMDLVGGFVATVR